MPVEVFPLQSKRAARQRKMQVAQHLLAAILLINTGVLEGAHSLLSIAEIVAGGLLIVAVLRERARPGHHGGGVAWVELVGAAMMTVEAVEKTRGPHHVSFVILSFVAPLVLFLFAIFDARIAERRYLRADDDTLEMRLRLLLGRRVRWSDIRSFRVAGDAIELEGAKKLRFRDVVNRDEAMQWTATQLRRRGIEESMPHETPGGVGEAGQA